MTQNKKTKDIKIGGVKLNQNLIELAKRSGCEIPGEETVKEKKKKTP